MRRRRTHLVLFLFSPPIDCTRVCICVWFQAHQDFIIRGDEYGRWLSNGKKSRLSVLIVDFFFFFFFFAQLNAYVAMARSLFLPRPEDRAPVILPILYSNVRSSLWIFFFPLVDRILGVSFSEGGGANHAGHHYRGVLHHSLYRSPCIDIIIINNRIGS